MGSTNGDITNSSSQPAPTTGPTSNQRWRQRFQSATCLRPGPPCHWIRSCLCCSGNSVQVNQILPVTLAPTQFDFIEIRPNRRIRVIHMMGCQDFPDHNGFKNEEEEEEEEEYWFENSAPKRMPIVPFLKTNIPAANRVINKFEPQPTPRIPGIKPPRHLRSTSSKKNSDRSSSSSSSSSSPSKRLPRKIILAATETTDIDDDDDCVKESPDHHGDEITSDQSDTAREPVDDDNFMADVLAGMSDMVLHITADANAESHSPKSSLLDTPLGSPKLESRKVVTDPHAENSEEDEKDEAGLTKVVVEGGHMGGRANVGFEHGEEEHEKRNLEIPKESLEHINKGGDPLTQYTTTNESIFQASSSNPSAITNNEYQNQQSPTRPILFFIHGVGGSASTWTSQLDFFARAGYEIVAPDLMGHGFSSVPDNPKCYTFNKLFRDLLTIFDHYINVRSCVVIAHSYGCSFAAALARSRPNSVLSLILVACGGPTPLAPPPAIKSVPATLLVTCIKPFMRCGFKRQQKYNPRGKALKFQQAFDVPAYVFRHIMAGQSWPEGDAGFHRRITVPTLLVYGLKDPLVSLVEMCEMERTIPRSYLELVSLAGHMVMLEQPKELNVMMKKFIEKYFS